MERPDCPHQFVVTELVEYGHDCITRCRQCGKELWRQSVDGIIGAMAREARQALGESE